MLDSLDFAVLGPLEVRRDSRQVVLGGCRQQSVLAYLIVNAGRVVTTDQMVTGFTVGADAMSAGTLHAYISRLRKVIDPTGEVILRRSRGYLFDVGAGQVDSARFELRLSQATAAQERGDGSAAVAHLDGALALWRGAALDAFAVEAFACAEAARLEELRLVALEDRADLLLALGRHTELVGELPLLQAAHPFRERLVDQLMVALYRAGQQAEALHVYARTRAMLGDQLGVDPSPALQRRHQAVLRQDSALDHASAMPGAAVSLRAAPARNLPHRSRGFFGRSAVLDSIAELLGAGDPAGLTTVVLYGLGGVGKTQLVLEHAHRELGGYEVVWWVPAASRASTVAALVELVDRLGIKRRKDEAETLDLLWSQLRQRGCWLIVYDNAASAEDLEGYLPAAGAGHVLITSRNPAWGRIARRLSVDVFPRDEAVAFVTSRIGSSHYDADRLADSLGDLPLALEQAVAYVEEADISPVAYLELFQRRHADLLARSAPADHPGATATTWQLAFDRLAETSPAAAELLEACAFLAPDGVPLQVLAALPSALPPDLAKALADELGTIDAVRDLLSFSLVQRDGAALRVHRLVQLVVREALGPQRRAEWLVRLVEVVDAARPDDPTDPSTWPVWERLAPQLLALAEHADEVGIRPPGLRRGLHDAGRWLTACALFSSARSMLEWALRLAGSDPASRAAILSDIGELLEISGDLPAARQIQEQALRLLEDAAESDPRSLARSLGRLGKVLFCLRELAPARAAHERGLALLDGDDPADLRHKATVRRDLGFVLWAAGEADAAVESFVLALRELEALGATADADVAHTLSGLGQASQDAGDHRAALDCQRRALAILEQVRGPDHPEVAHTLDKLGYLLRLLGEHAEAARRHQQARQILAVFYGLDHPETAMPLTNLGLVLLDENDLAAAEECQRAALEVFQSRSGPAHPHTQLCRARLAAVLLQSGHVEPARDLLTSALTETEQVLGPAHPDVGRIHAALAETYDALGEVRAARHSRSSARDILSNSYGPLHHEVLALGRIS